MPEALAPQMVVLGSLICSFYFLQRFSVLRWIAAVGSYLESDGVRPYLTQMLKPVYRELDGGSTYVGKNRLSFSLTSVEIKKSY